MLSLKKKDIKFRKQFFLTEKKLKVNKFLLVNFLSHPNKIKFNAASFCSQIAKIKNNQNSCKIKLNNRCVSSNRGRGVLRSYSLSRIVMREYLQFGVIPGFRKAVW